MSSARRLLVRAPSWLGDFCMAEPVFAAVAAACESWTLAGPSRFLGLLDGRYPNARRIATDRDEGALAEWRGHDLALFLNGSPRSLWTALRAGIPERVAWDSSGRGWLATRAPKPARESGGIPVGCGRRGRFPRRLPRPFGSACIELAGLAGLSVSDRRPRLFASSEDLERVRERLRGAGLALATPFLWVNLGGPMRSAKTPPREAWRTLLRGKQDELALPRVLVCGPGEEDRVLALAEFGVPWIDPVATLGELLALCELAAHGLTPDSGPRHLAQAAGLPLTVLFGPTDPRHTAEHTGRTKMLRGATACAPCHLPQCPLVGEAERSCHSRAD